MFAMHVPYVSQWDATAHLSRGDCGIVAACMCALWKGVKTTPDEMLLKAKLPIGRHYYDFPDVILAAQTVGLKLNYCYPANWNVIRAELLAGRPVISLLRYGMITHNQDDFDGSHFWLCIGFDDQFVYVNDPNFWGTERGRGAMRPVPLAEFNKAIGPALLPTGNKPYQSLLLG